MSYEQRRQIRRQLEADLETHASRQQLVALGTIEPAFRRFRSWSEVIDLLLDWTAAPSDKDNILRVLVDHTKERQSPMCGTVLLLAFWPALSAIARRRPEWNNAEDELWHILEVSFLETVSQLNVESDPHDIPSRLVATTAESVRRTCRREMAFQRRRVNLAGSTDSDGCLDEIEDSQGLNEVARIGAALAKRRIARACRSGQLNQDELRLLSEIDFEGSSIEEAASRRGLPYETIKRRRQRLLRKLRPKGKKSGLTTEILSPKRGDDGPSIVGHENAHKGVGRESD